MVFIELFLNFDFSYSLPVYQGTQNSVYVPNITTIPEFKGQRGSTRSKFAGKEFKVYPLSPYQESL